MHTLHVFHITCSSEDDNVVNNEVILEWVWSNLTHGAMGPPATFRWLGGGGGGGAYIAP